MRNGRPYPADPEYSDYAVTLKADLSLPVYIDFMLSKTLRMGFGLGPAFIPAYPVKIWDTYEWDGDTTNELLSYLYAKARYVFAESALRTEWRFSDRQSVSWTLRGLLPLAGFWDGENRSWYDGLMVQLRIGILFRL